MIWGVSCVFGELCLPRLRRLLHALLARRIHPNNKPVIPRLNRHVLRLPVMIGLVDGARASLGTDDLASRSGLFGEVGDVLLGDPLGRKFGTVLVHDVLHTSCGGSSFEPGVLTFHAWNRPGKTPDVNDVSCADLVSGSLDFANEVLVGVSVGWAVRRGSLVLTSACVGMGRRWGWRVVWGIVRRVVGGVSWTAVLASARVMGGRWVRGRGAWSTGGATPGKILVFARRAFNTGDRGSEGESSESNEGDERLGEHRTL